MQWMKEETHLIEKRILKSGATMLTIFHLDVRNHCFLDLKIHTLAVLFLTNCHADTNKEREDDEMKYY